MRSSFTRDHIERDSAVQSGDEYWSENEMRHKLKLEVETFAEKENWTEESKGEQFL